MSKRLVFVGGGSGGHFYPLIAVAEAVRSLDTKKQWSFYYIGPSQYEPSALASVGMQYIYCPAGKRRRYFSLRNFIDTFKIFFGIGIAFFKLLFLYPDVIFSKGGYTSVPVMMAAKLLRIPVVIHESDATPGRANTFAKKFARYIGITYDDAAQFFPVEKTALVGIPTRSSFFAPLPANAPEQLGIDPNRPMIFVTGGSQGAERVNELVLSSLDELLPHYTIVHQVGTRSQELMTQTAAGLTTGNTLGEHYHVRGHMDATEFSLALSLAAVVVSRAGSGSINEIALKGKPAILIPIPEDISHDQRTNAYAYARTGAASVMEEQNLTDNLLVAEITRIMSDGATYQSMSKAAKSFALPDAATKIASVLLSVGDEH